MSTDDGTLQDLGHEIRAHFHYALEAFKQHVIVLNNLGHGIYEIERRGGDTSHFSGDTGRAARLIFALNRDWQSLSQTEWQAIEEKVMAATIYWMDATSTDTKHRKKKQRSRARIQTMLESEEEWIAILGFLRLKTLNEIAAEERKKRPRRK
jgi:hypothetical protein